MQVSRKAFKVKGGFEWKDFSYKAKALRARWLLCLSAWLALGE
jgi:hypothetical protein